MEFCVVYYHGPNDKLEMNPLPKNQSILSTKTTISSFGEALKYLGQQGWTLDSTINMKKLKWMQLMFKRRSLDLEKDEIKTIEYCVIHHALGDKLEMYPPLKKDFEGLTNGTLLSKNAYGDDLIKIMNFLSSRGWILKNTINVKKTKSTQYIFVRVRKT